MQLRVLTLNIWGVRYLAKLIDARIRALVEHLNSPEGNYDIVGLQEVWSKADFVYIRDQLQTFYPHSYYFLSGLIGSGCCIFSKHPIINVFEHRYTLNGFPHKIQHGDWFCGKLIGLCKILIKGHVVNVYNTHLHANYHHVIPNDIYLGHRICQAYELVQFIESTSSADTTDLMILLGDLNLRDDDLGFQLIRGILQLNDCFLTRIDQETCDPSVGNSGVTCDLLDNPYVIPHPYQGQGERIDYILYRARNDNVKCLQAYPTLHKVLQSPTPLYYSDHLAVYAVLELDEKAPNKKPLPLEDVEIADDETRKILRDAVIVVEETIQRTRRHRFYCGLIAILLFFILFYFNEHGSFSGFIFSTFSIIKNLLCIIGISICVWFFFLGKPTERNALSAIRNAMHLRLRAVQFSY